MIFSLLVSRLKFCTHISSPVSVSVSPMHLILLDLIIFGEEYRIDRQTGGWVGPVEPFYNMADSR